MKGSILVARTEPGTSIWQPSDATLSNLSIPAQASGLRAWASAHSLVLYFLLAYAVAWAVEIPLALQKQGLLQTNLPNALHYLASFGPLTAALVVTGLTSGRPGFHLLLARLFRWRVGARWYLAALSPVWVFALCALAAWAAGGPAPDFYSLGQVDYLPYLGILGALVLWLLTFGLSEEIGWRGFALPRLQKNASAYKASLILGLLWGCWHAPLFFYRDTFMAMGPAGFPMLLASLLAASMILTWLFNSTGGSILLAGLFHAVFNQVTASSAGGDLAMIALNAGPFIGAVLIVLLCKPAHLSRADKQVAR